MSFGTQFASLPLELLARRAKASIPADVQSVLGKTRLELGDFVGAEADMQALAQSPYKNIPRWLAVLSALMLLRQGRYAEALEAALAHRRNGKWHFGEKEMLAARFEAAHRLGKPGKAGRLTDKDILFLRKRGYGVWMDKLIADYGAGKKHA